MAPGESCALSHWASHIESQHRDDSLSSVLQVQEEEVSGGGGGGGVDVIVQFGLTVHV